MTTELIFLAIALAVGLAPIVLARRTSPLGPGPKVAAVALGVAVFISAWTLQESWTATDSTPVNQPQQVSQDGYVSSDTCRACHPKEYDSWQQTYHRTLTQRATPQSVKGNFDNVELTDLKGVTYTLTRRNGEFWIAWQGKDAEAIARAETLIKVLKDSLPDPGLPEPLRQQMAADLSRAQTQLKAHQERLIPIERPVVLVTGSHHQQIYWYPSTLDLAEDRTEITDMGGYNFRFSPDALQGQLLAFPFAHLVAEDRWVYREAVFVSPPSAEEYSPWNSNCLTCHTTDGRPMRDLDKSQARSEVAELGIACEACHGPGKEHVAGNNAPYRRYGLHLGQSDDPSVAHPERFDHKTSSQICGQCHSIGRAQDFEVYNRMGSRYRPGTSLDETRRIFTPADVQGTVIHAAEKELFDQSFWSDGAVRVNGREYNGLLESGCYQKGEMSCMSCHQMHGGNPEDQLKEGMRGDKACTQCHDAGKYADTAHTHHPAQSSGARCQSCHMPYTVFGLLKSTRSHTIEVPSIKTSLQTGRPHACTICHMDKPLQWANSYMETWYGQPAVALSGDELTTSATALGLLKGDAGVRALVTSNLRYEEHLEVSGRDWLPPILAQLLDDPYHAVRFGAYQMLRRQPGFEDFEYDYIGDSATRQTAVAKALDIWRRTRPEKLSRTGDAVLIGSDGELMQERVKTLLQNRDNRPVTLAE